MNTNNRLLYIPDAFFSYPIHHAAFNGYENIVSSMISRDPWILTQIDGLKESPFHSAIRSKIFKLLKLMWLQAYNSENGKALVKILDGLRNEWDEAYSDLYKCIAGPNNEPLNFC